MYLDPLRSGDQTREEADGARSEDEQPITIREVRGLHRAQRVAAGFDQSAERVIHRIRQGVESRDRHCELLGQRAVESATDANLVPEFAHVLVPLPAAAADSATEHGVTGHSSTEPGCVNAVPDGGDRAHPLVTEPHRELGESVVQVLHLAGVKLDVGAADAGALDVDDDTAGCGHRWRDVLNLEFTRTGENEGAHDYRFSLEEVAAKVSAQDADQGNVGVPVAPTRAK
jgi:hypothetical protein